MAGGAALCAPPIPLRGIVEMSPMVSRAARQWISACLTLTAALFVFPTRLHAWGANAQKLVVNQAIDTLPSELRSYFEANRGFLVQHVVDPLDAEAKIPAERHNHFLRLDKYGRFPYDALPRSYKAAVTKF